MDLATLRRLIAPLQRRVALMLGRCVLTAIDDAAKVQRVQLTALRDEVHGDVERFQDYGFTSVPLPGAEAVAVFVAGNRGHGIVVVADDRRYRKTGLAPGEVAVYDLLGKFVHLRADGTLHLKAPRIELEADDIVVGAAATLRLWAGESYREDVGGYAIQLDALGGGTWRYTNWTTGAVFDPAIVNAIEPPRVDDV